MGWDKSKFKTYDTSEGYGNSRQWKSAFHERIGEQEAIEILSEQDETPYQLLGITEKATQAEIKAAYRAKMMQWHPDRNPDRIDEATKMSKRINAAYSLLYKN